MTNFDTKTWDLRNAWPLPSGELAVREALTQLEVNAAFEANGNWAGFSVKNPRTNTVFHYAVMGNGTALNIYDENFIVIQTITLIGTIPQRVALTYAIVEDEIIITSPYLSTYWGLIGDGLIRAVKVASVNPNTTAIDVPKGISVGWAGRAVVSDNEALYFSDALAPRTFVAENVVIPPGGTIYGLHVNSGGALIVVTSGGVYALPEDAAASGQIVVGIFSKLTDYQAVDYETSCQSHGQVYGLTEKGYRRIDIQGSAEVLLDEQVMSRSDIPRISFLDYRACRMFSGSNGPIISINGYIHMTDLVTKLETWWATSNPANNAFDLTGIFHDNTGEEFYLCEAELYAKCGNNSSLETVTGFQAGRVVPSAGTSSVIRWLEFLTDCQTTMSVFLNNASKTVTPKFVAPVIGTDTWDGGTVYREAPLKSYITNWAVRGNELTPEFKISNWPSRFTTNINMEFRGPGKFRPGT